MSTAGFLGIDAGTQGLSVVFTDQQLNVLAVGESTYEMIQGLNEGCYEQSATDWVSALRSATQTMRNNLAKLVTSKDEQLEVLAIGISGQMHGEVISDKAGNPIGPVRLWCDSRNEDEGNLLTNRFGVKMPKRITAARWLWTTRNQPERASAAQHLATPAGWLAHQLTGEWNLGIGDAAGMFPIDQQTMDYDSRLLADFDSIVGSSDYRSLEELLPRVRRAGEDGGKLSEQGAEILGLPSGIPVAPAEGDQPASLAGSLIGDFGMVSVSFGTSVCANSVGDKTFEGVSDSVDHFCAPDGKPINMVWLRNGTTFMNTMVELLGSSNEGSSNEDDKRSSAFETHAFEKVMPQLLNAAPDCGGLLALPFMDDEPGLNVAHGGTACLFGINSRNATPGNVAKAALLSTMFNLKLGSEVLDRQGFPRDELVLSGGLTRTPELGQILADVFDTKVSLLDSAEEGTAWGAAVMAGYRCKMIQGDKIDWPGYLNSLRSQNKVQFTPDSAAVQAYSQTYERYKSLVKTQPALQNVVGTV